MTNVRISVAMATYNGEQFLRCQLDSIAGQTVLPFELVIGDDGSTDATLAIIEKFKRTAPFPVKVLTNFKNLGYADNFLNTAARCKGEWIAFCDQDDIWMPDKIKTVLHEIKVGEEDLLMVIHAAEVVDQELQPIGRLLPAIHQRTLHGPGSHYGFWMQPGFGQVVNARLIASVDWTRRPLDPRRDAILSHDGWACMLANALGSIALLPNRLALYRRHGSALTGFHARSSLRDMLDQAASTGADHYAYLAQVANETAHRIRELANDAEDPLWSRRLATSAACYEHLALVQAARARLYSTVGMAKRLAALFTLSVTLQAYFGNPGWALGPKAMAKDISAVVMPGRIRSESHRSVRE